ncbi:MAG: hypothetical protein M3020_05630 [Myxococcota bacterium]|nr:hypothetical protein [Myxococcota bacterium]
MKRIPESVIGCRAESGKGMASRVRLTGSALERFGASNVFTPSDPSLDVESGNQLAFWYDAIGAQMLQAPDAKL